MSNRKQWSPAILGCNGTLVSGEYELIECVSVKLPRYQTLKTCIEVLYTFLFQINVFSNKMPPKISYISQTASCPDLLSA